MNFHQKQSPILGHDYPQWSLGRGRGSFAEFSKIGNVLKDFPCQSSIESNTTFTPVSSAQYLQSSFQEAPLSIGASFNMERASPGTAYSSYSPMTTFVDPQSLISGLSNNHTSSTKTGWWPQISSDNRYRDEVAHEVSLPYDGLPKDPTQPQQQYCDLWNNTTYVADDWTAQAITSSTISPKVLTLNVSSNLSSSSSSSQEGMTGLSGPNTVASSSEESSDHSGTETLAIVKSSTRSNRQRQTLPDAVPNSRRIVPVLPSNDFASHENTKKRSTKIIKSGTISRRKSSPTPDSTPSTRNSSSWRAGVATPRPKKLEPKPVTPEPESSRTSLHQSSATVQATHHRDAKDDFLVRSKLAGMSYKEIRRQGKFSEAESTLRGRFRTLTKHKAARVRKPEWDDNDVS
jgi:hypothetical protein